MGDINKSGFAFYKDDNWYSILNEGYYGAIPVSGDTIDANDYDLGNYAFGGFNITFVNFPNGVNSLLYGILKTRHILDNDTIYGKFQELIIHRNVDTLTEYYMRWYSSAIDVWLEWTPMHS